MTLTRPNLIKLLVPLFVFLATLLAVRAIDDSSRPRAVAVGIRRLRRCAVDGCADRLAAGRDQARLARRRHVRGARQRLPSEGARDLRPQLLRPRRDGAPRGAAPRPARRGSADGDGLARERAPRLHAPACGSASGRAPRHPASCKPYGVIVDALVELGRYDAAERALQRMVDLKPNLDSYARVVLLPRAARRPDRRHRGDAARRLGRRRRAREPRVRADVARQPRARARRGSARPSDAYRLALSRYPEYAPAQAGLARADAARGDLAAAIRRYERVVERLPLPEYAVALAEAELAAGRRADAREDLALVEVQQRLLRRSGVNIDAEMAVFEADHGSPERAVRLARAAWADAPSVRAADALGWALTRAGEPAAGPRLRAARAAARLAGRGVPVPRRDRGARCRAHRHSPAAT